MSNLISDQLDSLKMEPACKNVSCSLTDSSCDNSIVQATEDSSANTTEAASSCNGNASCNQPETSAEQEKSDKLGDLTDAGGFGILSVGITNTSRPTYGITHTVKDSDCYSMKMVTGKRGYCLIFNHMKFSKELQMNERKGTNKDRDEIANLFKKLQFTTVIFNDLTYHRLKEQIDLYASQDHSQLDCLAVFMLTHGEDGHFYAQDAVYKHEVLFRPFEGHNCPTLAGKPKMFFIQACRGGKLDQAVPMYDQTDAPARFSHKLPVTADIITMWSTVPGYYSWRNTTNGSWFIQSLLTVINKHALHLDLGCMHPAINRHMVLTFESNTPGDPHMHGKKQVSSMVSTATHLVHFYPPTPPLKHA